MGTTTSRPILHGVESTLLRMAQLVETVVRTFERLLSSLFTLCLPSTLYEDFQLDDGKNLRACDEQGMCYIPATRVKQHADLKQKREERHKKRKLRAEWAAAGLDVNEMEKQELAKKKRQMKEKEALSRTSSRNSASNESVVGGGHEKQSIEAMLGTVARAPPPRPETERETRAERERGKLWIMGNIGTKVKSQEPAQPVPITAHKENEAVATAVVASSASPGKRKDRRTVLESVREASHHEQQQREYAMQGHGGRIASGASEHGDISYQIVATSKANAEEEQVAEVVAPKPRRRKRSITPHGIMLTNAAPNVSAMTASMLQPSSSTPPRPSHKPHSASLPCNPTEPYSDRPTVLSQPTLVQPTAQRLKKSLNLLDLHGERTKGGEEDPVEIQTESPLVFTRARASLDLAVTNVQVPSPPSLASSDTGSIASRRSHLGQSLSRSSTPPCVMSMADRACKSRWEANAKERKVWKGEVNRIALEKLHQTSKKHHETTSQQARAGMVGGAELRLHSTTSAASTAPVRLVNQADKKLRRSSFEPTAATQTAKVQRRSSQKA